jgi:deoxyribonucleoside regulator
MAGQPWQRFFAAPKRVKSRKAGLMRPEPSIVSNLPIRPLRAGFCPIQFYYIMYFYNANVSFRVLHRKPPKSDNCKLPVQSVTFVAEQTPRIKKTAPLSKTLQDFAVQDDVPTERIAGRVARNRMRIAWMYYVEGLTQNEIADRLGIGRVTVVRNINEAVKQREVKIWITGHVAECLELEAQLKEKFGLIEAVVVPEPANPENTNRVIGNAAGMYITDQLADDICIGVGWGATLYNALQTLSPRELKNVDVVSMLGGIVEARRFNPSEFAWQFANTVGANCYLLAAPAVVDSEATRKALIEQCGLDHVLNRVERMEMALLSVGTMSAQSTSFRFGFFSEDERQSLIKAGAVGDMLYNFYDRAGKLVEHPINRRVMSMPIERLKRVPKRVMVSGGNDKVEALRGGLKLVDANVLVTNEDTARRLVDVA